MTKLKPVLARTAALLNKTQELKNAQRCILVIYTVKVGGVMRVVSLNGAAFIFLQRGEKLRENEGLAHNKFPDRRYVIWPRANGWDVRVKVHHCGKMGWEAIAESLFSDEDKAWLSAYDHLHKCPAVRERHDDGHGAKELEPSFVNPEVYNFFSL